MVIRLRAGFFWFVIGFFGLGLFSVDSFAAGCNGADGLGIYTGSIANRDNGTVCANNPIQPALLEIDISNIDESGVIQFEINWDDGSAPERVNAVHVGAPGSTRYFAARTHLFPPNGGQVKCEYRPRVNLVFNGTVCAATLGVPPRFVRWNTDDQNTGILELEETVTGVNEYLVCAGVETNVTFTDRSTLNCVPPDLILGPNDKMRWRRFIYGTATTITGAVRIGGTPRAFPYNGTVDASTEPTLNSGFPTATTQIITVPATAQVGEIFEITMDYWNTCNPYPARQPVLRTARIRIVDQPPAPGGTDQTVCNGTTPSNFNVTGVPPTNIVTWYRNVPGSPDAPGTAISSGTSTSLPVTSVPGYTNNTTAGIYKVWVSYRPNIANALNCESALIPLTKTIREAITVPNPTTPPPTEICNNNSFTVIMPNPATTTIGGATQYNYTGTTGVTVGTTTATSVQFNVAVAFAPGQLFVDKTVTISRRYTTNPNCNTDRNFTVRVYNETVGGTPSPFPDVCEGTSVGPITLTGHLGTILRWEVSVNGGAFVTYVGPASGNSITPGTLTDGIYDFRAVVDNGPCNTVNSSVENVVVTDNPTPPTAGTDQAFCGSLVSAAQDATLPAGTGTWTYISSVPSGRPAPGFTNIPNTTFSITGPAQSGAYTMRWTVVSGSCTFSDDVVIDFGNNPDPVPPMTEDACGETATLNAPVPSIGSGVWTVISGPGPCAGAGCAITIDDINSPTSDVSLNGPGFVYGTYILEWRVTSGICPPAFNNATVNFYQPVTATATDINGICIASTGTAIPLTGTIGGGAVTGTWQVVGGTGTGTITGVTVSGTTVTANYNSTLVDYNNGTPIQVKLIASPGGGTCPPVEQPIFLNIDRTPVPVATPTLSTCESFIQLDAESPIPFSAAGKWTGPPGITFDNDTDPQTIARNLPAAPSSVTVRWTLTSAGGNNCTDGVNVQLNRVIAPPSTNLNLILCEVAPAGNPLTTDVRLADYENMVTSLAAADRTIQWYQNGPPPVGIIVPDPTVTFLNVPDGKTYIARITETATGCTSDAVVSINIRPLPTANNGTVALCEDTPGSNSHAGVDLINDFQFRDAVTNGSNDVTWFNTMADAVANVPGTEITAPFAVNGSRFVYARVSYTTAPACVNIAELNLAIKPLPTNGAILGRSLVCLGDPAVPPDELPVETYQVTSITGAKYFWNVPTGPGKFKQFGGGGVNDFFLLLQFPNIPTPNPESISVRIELNGCSTPVISLPIRVNPLPVDPIIVGTDIVCENDDGIQFDVIPTNFPSSNYSWEIRKQADDLEGGAFIAVGQGTDEIFVNFTNEPVYISVREVNSICVSDTTQFWVNVNRRPIMFDGDVTVCSDSPTNVIFQQDGASPVGIDKYNINTVNASAGINYVNPPGGPAFPVVGVAANAIENHAFENLTAVPLAVNYNVTPISVGVGAKECAGTPQVITVNVSPEPQLSPSLNRSICSGAETGITLISAANTFPADRFIINAINVPAGVTALVPGNIPVPGPGLRLDNVLFNNAWVNTTGTNQIVSYDILPYSTLLNCTGNPPTTVNVTIYPQTDVVPISPNPIVLCNGELFNLSFASTNNPDADFLWKVQSYQADISIGSPAAGQGSITNMIITNSSTTTTRSVFFQVYGKNAPGEEDPINGCPNPIQTFEVQILNSPVATVPPNLFACSDLPGGNTATLNLQALEPQITPAAGSPDTQITWYTADPRLGPAPVIAAGTLTAFPVVDGVSYFAEVQYIPTLCKKVVEIKYVINPNVDFTTTPTDPSCAGSNSGQIRVDVTNGTPGYTFSINGGFKIGAPGITYTFPSLGAGVPQSITVEDSKGCSVTKVSTLTDPPVLQATLQVDQVISCFLGKDGIISTHATGGTGAYTYLLLQTSTTDPNGDGIFENLGEGSYSVRVTDANGCTVDTAPVPLDPVPQLQIDAIIVTSELSCRDELDGAIEVTFSGGNPPSYTVTLSKAGVPLPPVATPGPTASFTGLGFGNYSAIVRDGKLCESLPAQTIIINPPPFSPGLIGVSQAICLGDDPTEIQQLVPAFGGSGTYTYQWEFSFTGNPAQPADWVQLPGATNPTYDPLAPPDIQPRYYRRIVTSSGCDPLGQTNVVKITTNPLPEVTWISDSPICEGDPARVHLDLIPNTGRVPLDFDYSQGATTFLNNYGQENNIIQGNNQQTETYTLLRVRDANGCSTLGVPLIQTIVVNKVSAEFDALAPIAQCSGGTFTFQWEVAAGVQYEWVWSDGQTKIVPADSLSPGTHIITRVFNSLSTSSSTPYNVRLRASKDNCLAESAPRTITVYPLILLNIIPGPPILCSGETITFIDQSRGVDFSRWYYRELGTNDEMEIRPGPIPSVTYTLTNNTTQNPITYEVVNEAKNDEGCVAEYRTNVKVYRGITADIVSSPASPIDFVGGVTNITFTNASNPLDDGEFDYEWNFDDARAQPATATGIAPVNVDYFSAGIRVVTLRATNKEALAIDHKTCQSIAVDTVQINLPLLGAAFKATPLASCFPVNITVENLSPGADTFYWEVRDQTGLVTTSNLREPVFRILNPGVYDIYLTASFYSTGQTATAEQKGIEVFDVPTALFEMRPNPIYVPDTELQTFNQSVRATQYFWDFDDGSTSIEFQPRHLYKLEGKYQVLLVAGYDNGNKDVDGDGVLDGNVICYDSTQQQLVALDGGFIKLPNAFTPSVNGSTDGVAGNGTFNDVFLPIARGVEEFQMQIFDRWGNLIFESRDRNVGWDGYDRNKRLMPAGVYVFKLVLRLSDGQRTTKIGDVTLIR